MWGRPRDRRLWLVAGAFAVSWVVDWMGHRDPKPTGWELGALYPMLQFGLLYAAFLRPLKALGATLAVACASVWAIHAGPLDVPTAFVTLLGSVLLVGAIWDRKDVGLLYPGLLIYFGLGSVLKAWWPVAMDAPTAFLWLWLGYQGCRLIGLGYVTAAIWRDQKVRMA